MPDLSPNGLIHLIEWAGYPGLFTIVFFETGVFFGFFLPGSSLLFTAGLMASQGLLKLSILIPLVALAAFLGDMAGYWFGSKVGVRLFLRPDSRFFKHEYLEQAKRFYDKYGIVTILLARFVPNIRTFTPIVAGIVQMRYRTFMTYNALGAVIWASAILAVGYYFGDTFPMVERYFIPIILAAIVASFLPMFWELRTRKRDIFDN